jgi:hypothetical protein
MATAPCAALAIRPGFPSPHLLPKAAPENRNLDPRTLSHAQLAATVADVQAILWKESRLFPDFPREYGEWNPAKEWEMETLEEIADVLADLKPPDFMPVDLAAQIARSTVIDANELLWAARILAGLVRVHRNVIPAMRENVKLAQAILESYADMPDFDPREQRWTVTKPETTRPTTMALGG